MGIRVKILKATIELRTAFDFDVFEVVGRAMILHFYTPRYNSEVIR